MTKQATLELAARIGARAGQSFVDTGIWPRCPFRHPSTTDLARAWRDAVFDVVGPMVQPVCEYWTRARPD
jgi:hypothetical protein